VSDEALWPFALEIYARPGVEAALLELQDRHGQCVPYLLWALWLGAQGREADTGRLRAGAALARSWQDVAVAPLRGVRRRLKSPVAAVAAAAQRRLLGRVQSLELDAERMLLRMLEDASPAQGSAPRGAAASLAAAIEVWGAPAPPALVAELARLAA